MYREENDNCYANTFRKLKKRPKKWVFALFLLPLLFAMKPSKKNHKTNAELLEDFYATMPYSQYFDYVECARFDEHEWQSFTGEEKMNAVFQTYFVSPSGGGNGLSPGSPWLLTQADGLAQAGDLINVIAGNYGSANIVFSGNGTEGNRIHFRGYTSSPGDVTSSQGSNFDKNSTISASVLPLLDKGGVHAPGTAAGIQLTGDYVTVENFYLTGGRVAFLGADGASNMIIRNVIVEDQGDQTISQGSPNHDDGFGFHINGDNALIENCFVKNATQEAYNTKGGNNITIQWSSAYANNITNPTDYYFLISGGSDGTIIQDSDVLRESNLTAHGGHGFDSKDLGTNSIIRRCIVEGSTVQVNFTGVNNNVYEDITIIGQGRTTDSNSGLTLSNGAHTNTFRRFLFVNMKNPVRINNFDDGYVGPGGDRDGLGGGNNSILEDFVFVDVEQVVTHTTSNDDNPNTLEAHGNTLRRWSIYNCNTFFSTYYELNNYIIEDIGIHTTNSSNQVNPITTGSNAIGPYTGTINNFTYNNNKHFNSPGSYPGGGGWASTTDPLYTNNTAYTIASKVLQAGSPWIGGGTGGGNVGYDHSGGGATCSDGIQNQGETGIDCGGPCIPCTTNPNINSSRFIIITH